MLTTTRHRYLARNPDGYGRYQASVSYLLPRVAPQPLDS